MSIRLLIDGYNLIGAYGLMRNKNLEDERNGLIKKLCEYKKIKNYEITVVFDGTGNSSPFEGGDRMGGISIIYSRIGESADDLIKRIVKDSGSGEGFIVVTSDREISGFCSGYNATVISSGEFKSRLEMASFYQNKDFDDDEENGYLPLHISTKKKGNPRKLSKTERQKKSKLRKL
ncbi:MAG: hypothetical protein A2043_09975 [Candidatus Schekmanbacteria bacterium GWA2_38_9]|uniref:RNA-binding protein n=1 Tax=Candidatus Schekmanbacteria bacterium RIFCSPLOWO2_12_FULL_38_15 TaxID=1817883 RepID=A0A1F7SG19_9BACT|nr:MAG: hypothetical protein A2043_09975 [Candidatus Schekmanbacteria bacterium GWA2_38_9]OGL49557.1 MAG: hypothetical protein A3H37_02485 [Candidatus Schekmanbacteria bacterium RIFCSPLOWO2_02_FULL_38_14]OGL52746.1 MAG: hypothetical protein A3G31_03755 [Candidatus Schekmanbacteria bacterium RIFCSPLOWO2_12_FULL_38_15]